MTDIESLVMRIKALSIVLHSNNKPLFRDLCFYTHLAGLSVVSHVVQAFSDYTQNMFARMYRRMKQIIQPGVTVNACRLCKVGYLFLHRFDKLIHARGSVTQISNGMTSVLKGSSGIRKRL